MFPSLIINLLWHILTSQLPSLEFMVYFWALVPGPFYIVTYLPQWVHINFYANYSYFPCTFEVQACHFIQYFPNLEILLDASRFLLFHISSINRAMHSILESCFESRISHSSQWLLTFISPFPSALHIHLMTLLPFHPNAHSIFPEIQFSRGGFLLDTT